MRSWWSIALLLGVPLVGCARTRPMVTDVGSVLDTPEAWRNKYVEVQGRVEEYIAPQGDEIRTWDFVLVDLDGHRLPVYVEGRNAEDVAAADRLVRAARREDAPVFLIGYLRTGRYQQQSGGPRLDLREVQYKEDLARLGPRYEHDRYDSPYRFHFGLGYYGHHHRHH